MATDETTPPAILPAPGSYEFNESENKVFAGLAARSRGVGFWSMLYGILILMAFVYGCIPKSPLGPMELQNGGLSAAVKIGRVDFKDGVSNIDLGAFVTGMVFLLLGIWSRAAGTGFQAVAKTQGSDIGHLMTALRNLSRLYGFLDRLIFFVVLLISLGMTVLLVMWIKG